MKPRAAGMASVYRRVSSVITHFCTVLFRGSFKYLYSWYCARSVLPFARPLNLPPNTTCGQEEIRSTVGHYDEAPRPLSMPIRPVPFCVVIG